MTDEEVVKTRHPQLVRGVETAGADGTVREAPLRRNSSNSCLPFLVLVCGTVVFATVGESQGQEEQPAAVLLSNELTGFRIDVDLVDAEIREVLRFFAYTTGLNVVIGPEVQGEVTVTLVDVPWDAAFVAILDSHGLSRTSATCVSCVLSSRHGPLIESSDSG